MLGFDEHEMLGTALDFFARVHPDDRELVSESLERFFKLADGIHQTEFRLQHRDGHYLSILSRGKVVSRDRDGAPQRVVGTHSDITPVKRAERALREKQSAEAASAAKSEFLSRMSHEIRTPLNAVNGFAQLLQLQLSRQTGQDGALSYVSQIIHASHHLMGLVNDVLDLQQVESGNLHVRLEALSLQDELDPCLAMLAPMASQRGITLRCDVHVNWLIQAVRQRLRLRQIIMNVGSNAIKYNREGGIVRIDAVLHASDMVALTFEDTGPGMTPRELTRLFQPFERLGKETSSIEGTGLGLIITRSLIEAMGGTMTIHSQPGAGTRVHLTFAKADDAGDNLIQSDINAANPPQGLDDGRSSDSTMPLSETHSAARRAPATPLRVLYVEDNRINAMLFEEALRPYPQIELEVAEDGQMAMSLAQERAPDVLVLDAHLPGMSGFEVFDALRALPGLNDVPAFMCSADAMPEDVARARDAGFAGYWTKPIDIVAVTDELCRLAARGDNAAP
jgi:PAS domain S-box-containing protein